jgi:ppGpp synthetase/RelA/SpoT-type nucleotidyltranferase
LFWRLERAYNEERPKYSRLVSTVGLILNAVCEQAGVPIQLPVEARSKEAESLFTKLCDWSNGSRKRCQRTPREWREAVESTNMSFIARHMPDIGGIRIVCVFEKDVERVRKAVDDLIKQGELVSRRSWAKKRLFSDSEEGLVIKGYRAWHCDVSLGKKRLALVECKGLQELVCEIQLKSAVSHAWAQASHRISYKTGVPRRVFKKKGGPLRQGIGRAALRLEDGDIALNQAKRAYEGLTSG